MTVSITIDGEPFVVPDEDDWELGELGELEKLRVEYGDSIGSLIGSVWMIKHRADPAFTIDDAKRIKVGGLGEAAEQPDPLPESPAPASATSSNGGAHSSIEADDLSGIQDSSKPTVSALGK